MQYDEDEILTQYVWNHFYHLMTDFEQEVGKAIIGRSKARNTDSETFAAKLNKHFGRIDREDINQALQEGEEYFRRKVRNRLLQEHGRILSIIAGAMCDRPAKVW